MNLEKKGGQLYQTGFNDQTEANLAAAKTYGKASLDSTREVGWLTVYNKNSNLWGFTYPGIGEKGEKNLRKIDDLQKYFKKNGPVGYIQPSSGHTHFDDNLSFSGRDLQNVINTGGAHILMNRTGDVSWVSRNTLKKDHKIRNSPDLINHLKKVGVYQRKTEDTQIYGRYLGNIYD